jgi:hypothetical protein
MDKFKQINSFLKDPFHIKRKMEIESQNIKFNLIKILIYHHCKIY